MVSMIFCLYQASSLADSEDAGKYCVINPVYRIIQYLDDSNIRSCPSGGGNKGRRHVILKIANML